MSDSLITLLVLGAAVIVFVIDKLPAAVVALLVPLALWASGVLDLNVAFAGFGDPTVLFIGALFVVSEALNATGVTAWVGEKAMALAGESRTRLLVTVMIMVALLTALISPNGSVAALSPVAVMMALRAKRSPSELLMPAAFAAHAGSLLMLTGSPVTVVVSDAAASAGVGELGLFSIALAGAPLLVGTIVIVLLLSSRLVPHRTAATTLRDLGDHGRTLASHYGLQGDPDVALGRTRGVAEFLVPPRSEFIGDAVHRGMVTESGRLVVAAMYHRGNIIEGPHKLCTGDSLLLRGEWDALENAAKDPNLIAVDDPETVRRQAVPLGAGAWRAIAVLAAMVVLLATGLVPAAVVGIGAGLAMVVFRMVNVEQAYRGISWTTLIMVGGMMSLSTAMVSSGAAQQLAEALVKLVGDAGPAVLLLGLWIITTVLGQLISNTATALIVIPVGLAASTQMGISPLPVLIAIAVFSAAALLTPVATPANLMVQEAAGYRFGDYWKLGLPLVLLYGLVGIFLVPAIWSF